MCPISIDVRGSIFLGGGGGKINFCPSIVIVTVLPEFSYCLSSRLISRFDQTIVRLWSQCKECVGILRGLLNSGPGFSLWGARGQNSLGGLSRLGPLCKRSATMSWRVAWKKILAENASQITGNGTSQALQVASKHFQF